MSTTAVQSPPANIVVPSIHLGSFSPYPKMPKELKHPVHFPEANTVPVIPDENPAAYQSRSNVSQWRPNTASYPLNQSYAYGSLAATRTTYATPGTMPRTPPPRTSTPSGFYSGIVATPSPIIPFQPPNTPAQIAGPPRDVCVECMMRDEEMADVDVTSPGIWDRESDVLYQELCAREEEEERERERNGYPTSSSHGSSSNGEPPRPRAKGMSLTEANLKVWLTLNPREPAAKQQTLHLYLDSQNTLLFADSKARLQAKQESRQLDDKMRDAYSQLRQSAYELGATATALDDGGVRIRSPSMDEAKHKRDTTLLENGMIVERVDMRKEEARSRKEERRSRKMSRNSLGFVDGSSKDRERDAASLYSFQAGEGSPSLRIPPPYDSTTSVPMPTSMSVRSMFTTPSAPWQQQRSNRPMSLAPSPSGSIPGLVSQTSLESAGPRRRFLGFKQWSGYFSSSTSLAPSGSMVDMHLGLDQEKQLPRISHVDIGSSTSSLRDVWPPAPDGSVTPNGTIRDRASSPSKKKKLRGLGRIWKKLTGSPTKADEHQRSEHVVQRAVEDDLPLAPPPPLSYLMNRSHAQSERSMNIGMGRHQSMSSLNSFGPQHPRSNSAPGGYGVNGAGAGGGSGGSPSDKSSMLPSPTEVRFPPQRDSSGDEPEEDDVANDFFAPKKVNGSPTYPQYATVHESEIRKSVSSPGLAMMAPPRDRSPSPSSITPTIKVPHTRPTSVMSFHKNLPPLPPGDLEAFPLRSATLPFPTHQRNGILEPQQQQQQQTPESRSEDGARRPSFEALASREALPKGARPSARPSLGYDDFGGSSFSFSELDPVPDNNSSSNNSNNGKRRSRFGLGALLGRKERSTGGGGGGSGAEGGKHRRDVSGLSLPAGAGGGGGGGRRNEMMGYYDGAAPSMPPAHAMPEPPMSPRSAGHNGLAAAAAAAQPRRPLDELVQQDRDFVAYRYPSKDERLDLSRP